jgi:4'-phosphopantetheinyl transferase
LDTRALDKTDMFSFFYDKMSTERKQKIDGFRSVQDKKLCLGAGILLDTWLSRYGLTEKRMRYKTGIHGKPSFVNFPELWFNVSHSEDKVICAFSEEEIGADIEWVYPVDLAIAIAISRRFHNTEYAYVMDRPTITEKLEAVFRLWCLKESFLKNTGYGLSLPLNSFLVTLDDTPSVTQGICNYLFYFKEYQVEKYRIAVCARNESFANELFYVRL